MQRVLLGWLLVTAPCLMAQSESGLPSDEAQAEAQEKPRTPFRGLKKLWPFKQKDDEATKGSQGYRNPDRDRQPGVMARFKKFIGIQEEKKPRDPSENVFTDMVRDVTNSASGIVNAFVTNWPVAPGHEPMQPYRPWLKKQVVEIQPSEVPILDEASLNGMGFRLLWARKSSSDLKIQNVRVNHDTVLVETTQNSLSALDSRSGFPLWTVDFENPVEYGPIFTQEGMYLISAGLIYCLSQPEIGTYDWRRPMPFAAITEPADYKKNLVFGGALSRFYSYHRKRRSLDWSVPTEGAITTAPVIYQDSAIFASERGILYRLSLESHKYVWRQTRALGTYSSPPVFDVKATPPRLFIGTKEQYLIAVDLTNGYLLPAGEHTEWREMLDGPITQQPMLQGDNLILAVSDYGGLHAIDRGTAKEAWFVPGIVRIIAKGPGEVYALTENREFVAVETAAGKIRWRHDVSPFEYIPSTVDKRLVILATNSGQIYALEPPVAETPMEDVEGLKPASEAGAKPQAEEKPAAKKAEDEVSEETPAEEKVEEEKGEAGKTEEEQVPEEAPAEPAE